jgi:hypothetical protein
MKTKWMKDGMVRELCLFPYDEVYKVFCALAKAADEKDLESLVWCARRLDWLHDRGETTWSDLSDEQQEDLLEQAWRGNMEPPPPLIAGLVAPDREEPEPVSAEEAGEALDTVRGYLAENLAKKGLPAALESIETLRGIIGGLAGEP